MRTIRRTAALAAAFGLVLSGADWPTQSGGPQRDAWARAEKTITKENVGSLELLYKYKSDNEAKGLNSLTPPITAGMLITYRGFKEMLLFAGSGDNAYSVDADLNRLLWKRHFETKRAGSIPETALCPGGLTASVAIPGSSSAAFRGGPPPPKPAEAAKKTAKPEPAKEDDWYKRTLTLKDKLSPGFGSLGGMFTVTSDGYLHALNLSTGEDLTPPVKFVPPQSNVSSLNVMNNIVFAATTNQCGGKTNALFAVDVTTKDRKVEKFELKGGEILGTGGTAIGGDGTVYVRVTGATAKKGDKYGDAVLALTPGLVVKDYFTFPASAGVAKLSEQAGITPAVLMLKDKELVVAGGSDGRVYLLDSKSLGGADHQKPLFQTDVVSTPGGAGGLRGAFSSSYNVDSETRWIYAPVYGPVSAAAEFGTKNGDSINGSVVAFQLSNQNGSPTLKSVWVSRDIKAPSAPATANGMVFVMAAGDEGTQAVLYALDGATGKELYSSGQMADTFSHSGGVAVANGRVYFTTHDNTVYCVGFSKLNPQLTDH